MPAEVIQPACRLVNAAISKTSQCSFWIPWEKGHPWEDGAWQGGEPCAHAQQTSGEIPFLTQRQHSTDFSKAGSYLCFKFLGPLCFGFSSSLWSVCNTGTEPDKGCVASCFFQASRDQEHKPRYAALMGDQGSSRCTTAEADFGLHCTI